MLPYSPWKIYKRLSKGNEREAGSLKHGEEKRSEHFLLLYLKIYYRVETLVLCIVVHYHFIILYTARLLCEVEIILLYNKLDTFIRVVSCCWANYFIYPAVFYLNANITAEPRAAWNLFWHKMEQILRNQAEMLTQRKCNWHTVRRIVYILWAFVASATHIVLISFLAILYIQANII